ncbi:glycosyltransferase [Microbulbifer sp. THAF38]|uniref:glycosyltransferase n=1 Tax=Microbulbifer sp. THAF38 TaxID=2587856 RepID=UPI001268B39B|nr:glycosyltransferase [Microbulbifer sp. THAF38]QFT53815.1 UDP-Glc:alpha-D-GlcNAc-diphosphoundecaprenol beta-1,3-glucosyltransferase WfgD [Microbulbifer sp. THAF38]
MILRVTPLGCDYPSQVSDHFDSHWYLQTYPDVADAGVNPWAHYIKHGRFEGRRPFLNRAVVWEYHLWRGGDKLLLPRLKQLADSSNEICQERFYAAWAIARWYAAIDDWSKVLVSLSSFRCADSPDPSHAGPFLLLFEAALHCKQQTIVQKSLSILAQRFSGQVDILLAEVNLLSQSKANHTSDRKMNCLLLKAINRVFIPNGLCYLSGEDNKTLSLDSLHPAEHLPVVGDERSPRVSVILPTYNSEKTLKTSLRSLCDQSWRNLEILVVDDASKDTSWQFLENFVRSIHLRPGLEIRILRHEENQGAYAARNTALKIASGDLITTHDSDDWSHPQKIEYQVKALLSDPFKVGCTSHWVRTTNDLHFSHWRLEDSWVYRNVSSLMFRRSVFEVLGYWDRVTVNGDTEYYYRILHAFGENALTEVLPGVPLSFGRISKGSLSRCSETSLFTRFNGIRKYYEDAAKRWHRAAKSVEDLYLPENPKFRRFIAPAPICPDEKPVENPNPSDLVQQSRYFDVAWYLEQYPDLQDTSVDLFEHYWLTGFLEGRDPGPEFSTSGYGYHYPEARSDNLPSLYHYLTVGKEKGLKPTPEITGTQIPRSGSLNLLVCAHQVDSNLFGAERSLLDVLTVLNELEVNLIVTLPNALNSKYVENIKSLASVVKILPYGWWNSGRPPCQRTLEQFKKLVKKYDIQAVYANTLVLDEPLLAARALEIPTIIHVRELPFHDDALCKALGASAQLITERVRVLADITLVNSRIVEKEIAAPNSVVVPNIVDVTRYKSNSQTLETKNTPICIALISNNLPKKGLADFVNLAKILEQRAIPVICKLIGPENEHIRYVRSQQQTGEIAKCIEFIGYIANPDEALASVDIVVNLSHFQESFGRTILEAMAAARPVVVYDWGALSELVVDGETGYLVPFGEIEMVARRVIQLIYDKELRVQMGQAGRQHAAENYSFKKMLGRFRNILQKIEHLSSFSEKV